MSSLYGILASMFVQTESAQQAKRKNAKDDSPLVSHHVATEQHRQNIKGISIDSPENLAGRTHLANADGRSRGSFTEDSAPLLNKALRQSFRMSA